MLFFKQAFQVQRDGMSQAPYSIHPTVRQLLTSDSLAEAQVVVGSDLLDRQVSQVISAIGTQPRAGSLVVTRSDALSKVELSTLAASVGLGDCQDEC
jgi:hypothetical protein